MGELGADCGPDSYCDEVAKACVDYDCAVGEKRCDGDRLEVCAADRLGYELVENCDETVAVDTPLACGMHTSSGEMACVSPVGGACLWYEIVTGDEILYRCSGDDPLCSGGSTTEQDFRCVDAGFTCADGDRGTCVGDFLVGDCFHGQPLGWDCASFGGECADGGGSATCIGLPEREACGTVTAGEMRCAEGLACVEGVCRDVAEYICRDGVLRERGGQRYVFCVHAVSLAEAEASCAREGMQLASHNDAVENAWIMTTAVNVGLTTLGAEWMWLGMNDIEVEGEWMWADGSPVTTFLWSYRQPDVPTLEQDCGAVNLTTQRWNDAWCDDPRSGPYPFACEGAAL
jgi:hypothetical protein